MFNVCLLAVLTRSEPLSTHIQRPYVAWFVCVLHYMIHYVKTDNTACWTKTLWHSLAYCWDPVDVLTIQTLLLLQPVNLEKCMISKYTKYSSNFDCWPFRFFNVSYFLLLNRTPRISCWPLMTRTPRIPLMTSREQRSASTGKTQRWSPPLRSVILVTSVAAYHTGHNAVSFTVTKVPDIPKYNLQSAAFWLSPFSLTVHDTQSNNFEHGW